MAGNEKDHAPPWFYCWPVNFLALELLVSFTECMQWAIAVCLAEDCFLATSPTRCTIQTCDWCLHFIWSRYPPYVRLILIIWM